MGEQGLVLVGAPYDAVCSSSTALVVRQAGRLPLADVNGYYAALGVRPTASRRELFEAYRDLGTHDARITYAFKQLRSRAVRAAYDATPAGEVFMDDYVLAELTRRAHLAVARFREAGHSVTVSDIFSSLGIDFPSQAGPDGSEYLDTGDAQGFDGRRPSPSQTGRPGAERWRYAYYLKGTACDDVARLAAWQEAIAVALAGCESVPKFSVGFHHATSEPFLVEQVDGIPVFLLHAEMESNSGLIHEAIATAIA